MMMLLKKRYGEKLPQLQKPKELKQKIEITIKGKEEKEEKEDDGKPLYKTHLFWH